MAFSEGLVEVWSNRSQPVQTAALVHAVKGTDDSYEVEVVGRDCYDVQQQPLTCPAEKSKGEEQEAEVAAGDHVADAAVARTGDEL